ncbi:MAG: family 16 glycoside hydrolase [Planctomycetota bacterium]
MIKTSDLSRRTMLKTILYTPPVMMFTRGGLLAAQDVQPFSAPKMISPGQKIRAAQVGVFNRGSQVLKVFANNTSQIEFKAFADVLFTTHGYQMKDYPGVPCYRDYRQMFEEMFDEIDAVIICTPDHSHFPVIMHAMLLGKHVYVEKPMAQNAYECRLIDKAAKKCGVVTQLGNQGHSGAGTIQFGQWVDAGLIKNVKRIDAWMTKSRRWHGWTYTDYPNEIPPAGYDWDQWLSRRPFRPHSEKMTGGNWRCWYEFGCGCMGDWGAHVLDAYHRYLKLGQPYEITTKVTGPSDLYYPQGSVITFKFKARGDMPPLELNWYDGQGNRPKPPAGYKGKMGVVGSLLYLDDGVVSGTSHGANYHFALNEKLEQAEKEGKLPRPGKKLPDHYKNFLNACQGIESANSPFSVGAPLSEMLCLGCIGQRFGGTIQYDAQAMKITNHPEADAMLRGPAVRENWDAYDQYKPVKSKAVLTKKPDQVQWDNLFKDADLTNWENPYDWGKAEYDNGVVSLSSKKGKWFLLTKKEYANFVLEGEIKMPVEKGNSGFLFRCQKKKNKAWGYQAEVDTQPRKWSGGLYDEGRRQWFISPNRDQAASEEEKNASIAAFRECAGECFKQGQWNKYRIVCIGSHIQISVNGVLTTDVHDEMDLQGYIGIQHHGEKGLVYQFRNLRIKDLGAGGEVHYPHRENAKAAAVASKMKGDIYEAEDAKLVDCKKATKPAGYQGTGFAAFGGKGSYVEWDNVLADSNAQYTLTFRYAAAKAGPCELYVNNRKTGRIDFAATGGRGKWKTVDVKADLVKGGNFIKVVAIGAGPDLDALAVTK